MTDKWGSGVRREARSDRRSSLNCNLKSRRPTATAGVTSAKEKQRLAGIERRRRAPAPTTNGVVTRNVRRMQATDDLAENIVEQRNILLCPTKVDIQVLFLFFRLLRSREKF